MKFTAKQKRQATGCALDMAAKLVLALSTFTTLAMNKGAIKRDDELLKAAQEQAPAAKALFSVDREAAYTAMVSAISVFMEAKTMIQEDLVHMGLTEEEVNAGIEARCFQINKEYYNESD